MNSKELNLPQYYKGDPNTQPPKSPLHIPSLVSDGEWKNAVYLAASSLVDAVNVALILNQPLLLTGEPGTGKTQLAYSVGRELGLKVFKFETKSTSNARDLFYTYDTLRRFHDAQLQVKREGNEYITYNALGIAILQSQKKLEVSRWLPPDFNHDGPQQSIVLIDEIDKAPRDFANDLLNEIDEMYFKIPELGMGNDKIEAKVDLRPVIFITSNSEKSLPDAFLRRCIFYDIPFPDRTRLIEIILLHMKAVRATNWLEDAMDLFFKFRESHRRLDKKPTTAELLNWIIYLRKANLGDKEHLKGKKDLVTSSLTILLKSKSDLEHAASILKEWFEEI
jgi:MoxR-like ATPase